jgi:hypothetical protein
MVSTNQFPNNQAELRRKIEDYLLNNLPRLYKGKKRCGQLQSYLELIVNESTKEAQNLIQCGMIENEAWNFAIRQAINRTKYL